MWTGSSPATLTTVGADDDSCSGNDDGNGSRVTFSGTSGTIYHVEVAGFAAEEGMFYLRAYHGAAQALPEPETAISKRNSFRSARFDAADPRSGSRDNASFLFRSDQAGATFQCALDGAAFTPCSAPVSLDSVTSGTHDFAVRAVVGGVPDATPAVQHFTIDHDPPDTLFTTTPTDPNANPTARFVAASSERNPDDTYQCAIDSSQLAECGSLVDLDGFCNRQHTVEAAGVDHAGNLDPTPATFSFTESGGGACGPPELGSLNSVQDGPTFEALAIPFNVHGDGGTQEIDYGPTAAYGSRFVQRIGPSDTDGGVTLGPLTPGTLYHWKVVVTTPDGTDGSGDMTFTTNPLGTDVLPIISVGTPVVVGKHALSVPLAIDPGTLGASYGIFLDDRGPIVPEDSPAFSGDDELATDSGPVSRAIAVTDLEPGTYHLRGFAQQEAGNFDEVMTPDVTVTVPPVPPAGPPVSPPPLQPIQKFKFRRGFIKVGKIRRGSKSISLVISHLPPSTSVGVTVKGTVKAHASASLVKLLGRGKARANKAGVARVKVKLSRKARKLLRKRTKSLALQVRVKPPGQSASSITLHRKPRR